jgi:hypothetical protein
VVEWIKISPLDQPKIPITLNDFTQAVHGPPLYKVLSIYFNELDLHFSKQVIQLLKRGSLIL